MTVDRHVPTAWLFPVSLWVNRLAIRRFLENGQLGPQEQQLLDLVYRRTLQRLGVVDIGDLVCEAVARKIIEVHKRGATDPIGISEVAIRELGLPTGK